MFNIQTMDILKIFLIAFASQFCYAQNTAIKMDLIGVWKDSSIIGTAQYDNAYNACWGLYVNGKEYGVIGSTVGTHIIDFNQTPPKEIFRIKGKEQGNHIVHREYYDYKCHLYMVCGEGRNNTLQVLDYSDLPNSINLVYDSNEFMITCHDIFIDQVKGYLYTTSEYSNKGFSPLGVYDINIPSRPKLIARYGNFESYRVGHVHAGSAKNDTVIIHNGYDGFAILDFKDKNAPKLLYENNSFNNRGYNHSGWFHPDGRHYCFTDENHGYSVKILDMNTISNSKIIKEFKIKPDISIAHNPYYSCDYLYLSYYYNGLQVFDTKDPTNPILTHYYPTSKVPNTDNTYMGAWDAYPYLPSGNILVSDMQDGLFLIKGIEKPCNTITDCAPITDIQNQEQHIPVINQESNKIILSNLESINSVEVYSSTGNCILKIKPNNKIEIPNLTAGIYIIKFATTKNQSIVKKIMVTQTI